MSNPLFILYCIPSETLVEECGAKKTTTSFYAANVRQARAMGTMRFMEEYPEANDEEFEFFVYEDQPTLPRSAPDTWDENLLDAYEWDRENNRPGGSAKEKTPTKVDFAKLSETMRICVLVKYGTAEITSNALPAALELTQDDAGTFEGHIVEAISKMPAVASMYPERIIDVIDHVRDNCPSTKKWPEIKAVIAGWIKQHEKDRKENNLESTSPDVKPGSGDPDRFDLVLALLVMGKDPAKAGAGDVKNAKHIKETRDPAWRGWRTTLIGIPGIYSFPEKLLYELTLDGMKNLSLIENSEGRLAYVREHFAGHPLLPDYIVETAEDETEQNTAGSLEDKPLVAERTGPFYWRSANGDKIGRANKLRTLESLISDNGYIEITQEEHQARKHGTWKDDSSTQEQAAQPEIKSLGGARFSIDGLMGEQPQAEAHSASNEVEKTEDAAQSDNFQQRAEQVEKDIAGQPQDVQDNLALWKKVHKTDEKFTKAFANNGGGTSINGIWMVMQATKYLGPQGINWKVEILEERYEKGAPIFRAAQDTKGNPIQEIIPDGNGGYITEINHVTKVRLWYTFNGQEGEIFAYGCTPYITKTKNGLMSDGEAPKKSLTDATKKALSQLGFSADVYLGLFDDAQYRKDNAAEFALTNAGEKAEDVTRLRNELDEKLTRVASTIEKSVSTNEAKKVFDTMAREVEVHRKAAEAKGDNEHAKYLSSRLRRLSQIKDQRIEALTKSEQSA
jgi:hypothetical protein